MKLTLNRCYYRPNYIIGKLFIDDVYFCDTLEPSLTAEHPCIPLGTYKVTLDVVSPKYKNRYPYKTYCSGSVPRLLDVPNRDGILIHIGNDKNDTLGCILVGENTQVGYVLRSTYTFIRLYNLIKKDKDNLSIEIVYSPLDFQSVQLYKSHVL